jgi:hypothetical protein
MANAAPAVPPVGVFASGLAKSLSPNPLSHRFDSILQGPPRLDVPPPWMIAWLVMDLTSQAPDLPPTPLVVIGSDYPIIGSALSLSVTAPVVRGEAWSGHVARDQRGRSPPPSTSICSMHHP